METDRAAAQALAVALAVLASLASSPDNVFRAFLGLFIGVLALGVSGRRMVLEDILYRRPWIRGGWRIQSGPNIVYSTGPSSSPHGIEVILEWPKEDKVPKGVFQMVCNRPPLRGSSSSGVTPPIGNRIFRVQQNSESQLFKLRLYSDKPIRIYRMHFKSSAPTNPAADP